MLGIAQRRRFGVNLMLVPANVGVAQNSQPFGIRSHDSILDSVVDHLHEMPGAIRTAKQIALFGGAAGFFSSRRARDVPAAGCQRGKNGIQALDHCRLASNHHAVTALQSPNATAGSDIDVVNSLCCEFLRAPNIVHVIGVAAVNECIARFEQRQKIGNGLVHHRGWNHQPDRTRLIQFLHEVGERRSTDGSFFGQVLDRFGNPIKDGASMAPFDESSNHVGAHPT